MSRKTKILLLCLIVGLVGVSMIGLIQYRTKKGKRTNYAKLDQGKRSRAVPVVVEQIKLREMEYRIEEVATVQPGRVHPISAEIAGRVTRTHFEVGRPVTKGQVLVELDTEQMALKVAEEKHDKQQAELDLKRAVDDLTRVQQLAKLLIQERKDQLAQVTVDQQKAADDLERSRTLHGRKIASATELADAEAKLKNLAATHTLARTRLELERTRQAQALADARHKRSAARLALALATNALSRALLDQKRHKITAPASGVVVEKGVEVGQRTTIGGVVGRIAGVDRVLLEVGLTEAELLHVRHGVTRGGLKIHCHVPEIGWDKPEALELSESRLVPMAGQTRTYVCWFMVGSAGGRLIPGMTVRVTLATGLTRKVLAIPRRAVREIHGKPYVFLAKAGKARLVPIEIEGYEEGMALVGSGLTIGDRLIVKGPATLGDRAPIREDGGKPGGERPDGARGKRGA